MDEVNAKREARRAKSSQQDMMSACNHENFIDYNKSLRVHAAFKYVRFCIGRG